MSDLRLTGKVSDLRLILLQAEEVSILDLTPSLRGSIHGGSVETSLFLKVLIQDPTFPGLELVCEFFHSMEVVEILQG